MINMILPVAAGTADLEQLQEMQMAMEALQSMESGGHSSWMGMLIGSLSFMGFFLTAYEVCMVVGLWRLFEKAGEYGWKALIPGYNIYTQYKLVWDVEWFWKGAVLFGISIVLSWMGGIFHLLAILFDLGVMFIWFNGNYKLAQAYGKGIEYALALVFIYPVGILLLAFGDSEYVRYRNGGYENRRRYRDNRRNSFGGR